ncbi:hypothetical protein B0A55_07942 [Friedmanniomyces simplex]|uniref:Rhodopsin domain-containing protein n=1 Tax=Friedmanniomyces simplex TaxID=329884 RepID=A0A4U0WTB0_9PEZI|nr:hypothetical protein B0A55_07942 [Friedmanniomyces simplex]
MPPFEDNAPKIVGTVVALTLLGSIVLPLRIHVRASNHALSWEDWTMMVALVPWAALSAVCIAGAFHGVGVAEGKLTVEERQNALMWFWLFEVLWCLAVIPVKLSISFMLGRIAVAKRPWVIGLYIISVLVTTITLLGFFYIIFRCTPIS